ncbi:MAG: T9SS type A sorting domain-containing protein [bacterium]
MISQESGVGGRGSRWYRFKTQDSKLLALGLLIFLLFPSLLFSAPSLYNKSPSEEKMIETKGLSPTGTISVLFLRVEFSDVSSNHQDFTEYMNKMGDYYKNVSSGKLNLVSTITQVFALTKTMAYYGNPEKPEELKNDAIATATAEGINLSNYDSIMLLHAGCGEETDNGLHPEWIRSSYIDGTYSTIPEMENFGISPFGVWCHEFGHQLGVPTTLPDLPGAGVWSLMDTGCYNGNGEYPAGLDAYSRIRLNWIVPQTATTIAIDPRLDYPVYQLGIFGQECFLVEKRDEPGLPGKGFLVWHLVWHQSGDLDRLSLLQADGGNLGDSGDPFPGSTRNFLLDDYTNPSLRYFNGNPSGFRIEVLIPHIPKAKVFPNPINLNETKRVFFEVERESSVFIYNIKGENIKYLRDFQNTGRIYWDIENIASGVYIFMVTDKDRNRSFGKIGIIK